MLNRLGVTGGIAASSPDVFDAKRPALQADFRDSHDLCSASSSAKAACVRAGILLSSSRLAAATVASAGTLPHSRYTTFFPYADPLTYTEKRN